MFTTDWIRCLLPALGFQLNWADRSPCPISRLKGTPSATATRLVSFHARISAAGPTLMAPGPVALAAFAAPPLLAPPSVRPSMNHYETFALLDVISAPLLAMLQVDSGSAKRVSVRERLGGAMLYDIDASGFSPAAGGTAAAQLASLVATVHTLTVDQRDEILGQVDAAWPFVTAAAERAVLQRDFTCKMLDVGLMVLHPLIAQCKHQLDVDRPSDPSLRTVVQVPGHQSAPSGHAAEAFLVAGLLAPLQSTAGARDRLFNAAAAVARNRESAGVHFEADSWAGQALGLAVAAWLNSLAHGGTALQAQYTLTAGGAPSYAPLTPASSATAEWQWLARKARAEW